MIIEYLNLHETYLFFEINAFLVLESVPKSLKPNPFAGSAAHFDDASALPNPPQQILRIPIIITIDIDMSCIR